VVPPWFRRHLPARGAYWAVSGHPALTNDSLAVFIKATPGRRSELRCCPVLSQLTGLSESSLALILPFKVLFVFRLFSIATVGRVSIGGQCG